MSETPIIVFVKIDAQDRAVAAEFLTTLAARLIAHPESNWFDICDMGRGSAALDVSPKLERTESAGDR